MSNHKPWEQKNPLTDSDVKKILQLNFPEFTVEVIAALGEGWGQHHLVG